MVVRITRNGQRRADVVSELFKYLRYRYDDGQISTLEMWDQAGANRGGEIYGSRRALWRLHVYVHPRPRVEVEDEARRTIVDGLKALAKRLGEERRAPPQAQGQLPDVPPTERDVSDRRV